VAELQIGLLQPVLTVARPPYKLVLQTHWLFTHTSLVKQGFGHGAEETAVHPGLLAVPEAEGMYPKLQTQFRVGAATLVLGCKTQ